MRSALVSLFLSAAVGLGSAAAAAEPPKPAPAPGAPAGTMMGHGAAGHGGMGAGAMGHHSMGMGGMRCLSLSDESLASAKAELKITAAQTPQWNAFADAEKSSAEAMRKSMGAMHGGGHGHAKGEGSGMMMTGALPERLERQDAMMTAHLDALRKVRAAVSPLYAVLTPDQKAQADRHLCGAMDHHGSHGMKGHDAHDPHPE